MITKLKPTAQDAVLGGQVPPPLGAVVLGGLEGVKRRLSSPAIAPRMAALREALNYGATGLDLVVQGLEDESLKVQRTALLLLWRRPESHIRQALANYSQYHLFDIVDTLQGHAEAIATLALSANGRILYSAGADFTIKVWDLGKDRTQHRQIGTIRGHNHIVTSIALSANGRILASGSRDKTIKLWDARSGKELLTLTGHIGYVNSVAITPDGKTVKTPQLSFGISEQGQKFVP
jgi:WD40 repeat protein